MSPNYICLAGKITPIIFNTFFIIILVICFVKIYLNEYIVFKILLYLKCNMVVFVGAQTDFVIYL